MNKTTTKVVVSDADLLAQKEKDLRKKYKRIVEGSIQRETEGSHAGKITVVITCLRKGCGATRRVATSDLFQSKYCTDCTAELRNRKRRDAAKAARKAAAATKGETVEKPKKGKKVRKRKEAVPTAAPTVMQPVPTESVPAEVLSTVGDTAAV
jgi:hypothetical protein